MTILFNSFLGAIGAGLLTLIILCIKTLWQKLVVDSITIKGLVQSAFFSACRDAMAKDEVSKDELENIELLYKGYKGQKLNGTGDRYYEIVMDMPIKKG